MDAVDYSTLPSEQQAVIFRQLQQFVSDCTAVSEAAADDAVVRTPTGDGMALAFFGDCSRPLRCAVELADRVEKERTFTLRMGIHSGDVVRQKDINGLTNVSGDGINIAQRVMDFGDGGHILMSLDYAKQLQASGNPAANDCYDIGIAAAKHGKRIHLFNYHRPAVGASDVPVRVRKDDHWIRPKQLRLGTSGHNIVVATLQILGWLFTAPSKWRTHVTQIDPRLSPNFTALDLTWQQIRRNPDLRQLLAQVYLVCPLLLTALILGLLTPMAGRIGTHPAFWVGMLWGMGILATLLLGVGAGLVGFVILAFQAVVQGPAGGIFGSGSLANMLAVTAVCVWAIIALAAVFPVTRRVSAVREVGASILAAIGVVLAWIILMSVIPERSGLQQAAATAAGCFVLINVVLGLRWKLWSRGFAFGQILGVAVAAVGLFAGDVTAADCCTEPWPVMLGGGLFNGLLSAAIWAAAFALAEKLAGARSAIVAGLLVTAMLNMPAGSAWTLLPFAGIVGAYGYLRKRAAPTQEAPASGNAADQRLGPSST